MGSTLGDVNKFNQNKANFKLIKRIGMSEQNSYAILFLGRLQTQGQTRASVSVKVTAL
jgi:hypothetical protein